MKMGKKLIDFSGSLRRGPGCLCNTNNSFSVRVSKRTITVLAFSSASLGLLL